MKLTETTLEVERSGSFQEGTYSFEANAEMFSLLSKKIYTDVPLAIVRELSTNASDSHTDAGCADQPFDVHLPNQLEPWLSIRDYGTGLSPTQIETVYKKYGKSTRTNSNDFTGCLGIGSKSPFAYTDQFTIISVWDKQKYTYSAFKNESSIPTLALLNTVDTDEPNGLEVRINTKPGDAQVFVKAAQRVYTFFKVRPNIVGAQLNFDSEKPEFETSEFSLYINHKAPVSSRLNVMMGQVCYAVSDRYFACPFGHNAIIILNLPMGAVSIAASREEVHYDDKTVANVTTAIMEAAIVVRAEFESRVANEGAVLKKLRALAKYRNLVSELSLHGTDAIEQEEKDKYSMQFCSLHRDKKLFINSTHGDFRAAEHIDHMIFIEDDADMTHNMKSRLRQYMQTHTNSRFYLVKIKDAARVTELFGDLTTKLSLLPDVPRKARTVRTTVRSMPIKLLNHDNRSNPNFEWDSVHAATDVDAKDACCVPRDGNWAIWNGQRVAPKDVHIIANTLGFERIYGISVKRYDSLRVKHGIIELSAVAKDMTEKLLANLDMFALSRFQNDRDDVSHKFLIEKIAGLSTECDNLIKVYEANVSNMSVYSRLCRIFDIKMPTAPRYQKEFFEKYPILGGIDWYRGNMTMEPVIQYIKLIEAV